MQFSLRALFVVVTVFAITALGIRWYLSAAPDVVITGIRFQPATPRPNELVGAIITYRNIGRKTASDFYLHQSNTTGHPTHDGIGYGGGRLVLEPGEEAEYHWGAIKFPSSGVYKLRWSADPQETLKESNEDNNDYEVTIRVVDSPL